MAGQFNGQFNLVSFMQLVHDHMSDLTVPLRMQWMLVEVDLDSDWKPSESKTTGHDKTEQPKIETCKQHETTRRDLLFPVCLHPLPGFLTSGRSGLSRMRRRATPAVQKCNRVRGEPRDISRHLATSRDISRHLATKRDRCENMRKLQDWKLF